MHIRDIQVEINKYLNGYEQLIMKFVTKNKWYTTAIPLIDVTKLLPCSRISYLNVEVEIVQTYNIYELGYYDPQIIILYDWSNINKIADCAILTPNMIFLIKGKLFLKAYYYLQDCFGLRRTSGFRQFRFSIRGNKVCFDDTYSQFNLQLK